MAILGASGHGKVVADTAELCGWAEIDFFDDAWPQLQKNGAWSVRGNTAELLEHLADYAGVVVAIGNNEVRQAKLDALAGSGAPLVSVIHPAAVISRYARLGVGTVAFAGAIVNASASVGMGCILNTASSVDHDCVLGDCVHISPGARLAGGVKVGALSWIGMGANVRQLVNIWSCAVVAAGAVVINDVPAGTTVAGMPAGILQK